MSIPRVRSYVLIILVLWCNSSPAQSIQDIDTRIAACMEHICFWGGYRDDGDNTTSPQDSLAKANESLYNYLLSAGSKHPVTIKAGLPKAESAGLTIVSSDDHKLRLYSWDTWMGGTMRLYENVGQYQTDKGVRTCAMKDTASEGDYGASYEYITTIHTKSNKTIYLVKDYSVVSTKDRAESIRAYVIKGTLLQKYNIFTTKTQQLSTIGYGYDAFKSWDNFPQGELPTIHLSKDRQKLYVPIVSGPTNEEVTSQYLIYRFDGNNYVFDKNLKQ